MGTGNRRTDDQTEDIPQELNVERGQGPRKDCGGAPILRFRSSSTARDRFYTRTPRLTARASYLGGILSNDTDAFDLDVGVQGQSLDRDATVSP